MAELDGSYVVLVYRGNDTMLEWDGYAENPSDALNKALAKREAEYFKESCRHNRFEDGTCGEMLCPNYASRRRYDDAAPA
jgi:hypothetical protein